ncbi:hypothetical protein Lser_V15G20917 [Lactuca serriola]
MAPLIAFTTTEKTSHNSHKFRFTLSPTNYGYWKTMIQPFLVTNGLFGYVNGTIPCPDQLNATTTGKETVLETNSNYTVWIANDAHVRMLLLSTLSEASFIHVQGSTSRDLWLSLERAYAPHTSSREYTLKTQLLKLEMKGDETSSAYLNRAQTYADALANIGEPMKEKDLVMLVISGLRDEYNGLKSTILARQIPTAFSELHGLLADHDYMVRKSAPEHEVSPVQAFTATTTTSRNHTPLSAPSADQLQALQQLLSQIGIQAQPTNNLNAQSFFTNRSGNNRGRGQNNRRGRGNFNRNQEISTIKIKAECGIGHVPSQCPNRDPTTLRRPPPSANYADYCSQASTSWVTDGSLIQDPVIMLLTITLSLTIPSPTMARITSMLAMAKAYPFFT